MPFIEHNGLRVLFIHVPKTGGTTIERWLESIAPLNLYANGVPSMSKCTPQHFRMRDIREILRHTRFDHVFSVVRNPYDRIASEYRMHAAIGKESFFRSWPSFSLWLERSIAAQRSNPFHFDNHLRPQWEFVGSGVQVFKFEDGLAQAVAQAAKLLGAPEPVELPHEYSTAGGAPVEWDRADRILVQEFYARDFREFGYSTEG
jgi:hypothetical protein